MEKNLSFGEISDFCKEFEQFMEFIETYAVFVLNLCGEKSVWRKNDKYEVCTYFADGAGKSCDVIGAQVLAQYL